MECTFIADALAKGRREGQEVGEQIGQQKGREEGEHTAKLLIAQNLLSTGMTKEQVAGITGLNLTDF